MSIAEMKIQADLEESFVITDDKKADWAIEKVFEAEAERDRLIELANEKIQELTERKNKIAESCASETSYLKSLLRMYFESVETTSTKTQESYKLLSGKLVLKRQQPEFIRDDKVMVEWAESAAPNYIKVTKSVNWADLKKLVLVDGNSVYIAETGETIPGIYAKPRDDVFEVVK